MLQKCRILAVTKCDLIDEELMKMLRTEIEEPAGDDDMPAEVVFVSAVTGQGVEELKDILWKELNSASNKMQGVISEEIMVHRDKQQQELDELEELIPMEEIEDLSDMDDLEDVEDLEDFEYVEV
jgi:GTP-binding protein